jgi:hypothetical protein
MTTTGPHPWLRKSFRFGIDARCLDTPRIHSIYSSSALPNSSRTGSLQLSLAGRHETERHWPGEGPASSPGASSTCAAAIQVARTVRKGRVFAFSARSTSSFPRRNRKPRWRSGRRRTHRSVAEYAGSVDAPIPAEEARDRRRPDAVGRAGWLESSSMSWVGRSVWPEPPQCARASGGCEWLDAPTRLRRRAGRTTRPQAPWPRRA